MKKINFLFSILFILVFASFSYAHQIRLPHTTVRVNLDRTESKLIDYYASNLSFPTPEIESPYGLQYLYHEGDTIPIDPFGNTKKVSLIPALFENIILFLISIFPVILTVSCIVLVFVKKWKIGVEMIAWNVVAWFFVLIASPFYPFYITVKIAYTLMDKSSLEYQTNLSKEINTVFYYTNTYNGDAVIGSPGPDFDWHTDLSMIPSMTTVQLKNELILYDSSNGMISGGDMIRIIHKPEINTQN